MVVSPAVQLQLLETDLDKSIRLRVRARFGRVVGSCFVARSLLSDQVSSHAYYFEKFASTIGNNA